MKLLKIPVLVALLLAAFVVAKAQNADEIMDKHLKAIGTQEAWNNIKSVRMEGTMSVQGMEIGVTQTILLGKAMRRDISVMGMSGYSIVTKTEGWNYMPFQGQTKPEPMKADMLKMEQQELELKSKEMYDYKSRGTKAELLGKDTTNKIACYKIRFTEKDGSESVSYFDISTYYIVRMETKIKQDDQEQEMTVNYNNYKKLDGGIVMPMSVSMSMGDITFKSIEINKTIDESIFKPADPKATTESATKKG